MLPTLQGHDVKNWDVPSAIDWSRMAKVLQVVKCSGSIPSDHVSRDDWHDAGDIPIDADKASSWKARFEDLRKHSMVVANIRVVWVLVEGFMLYWDQVCKFLIKEITLQSLSGMSECYLSTGHLHLITLARGHTQGAALHTKPGITSRYSTSLQQLAGISYSWLFSNSPIPLE